MAEDLLTSQDTDEARTHVEGVAVEFCNDRYQEGYRHWVFFEHGHWWLRVLPAEGDGEDESQTFDVVDAEPGFNRSGIDFEEC